MDQALVWWTQVVFDGWDDRQGPRYERLAVALADAVEAGTVPAGAVLPAERVLADALGVSRGTVVAALQRLAEAGVVSRRQGARTTVRGRPAWTRGPAPTAVASLLLRTTAAHTETIDLSLSVPAGTDHLPPIDWTVVTGPAAGRGLDPLGAPILRDAIARHLTERHATPTDPEQIVVTTGAHQALVLLGRALLGSKTKLVAGCPNYPGLGAALPVPSERHMPAAVDSAGVDVDQVARSLEDLGDAVVYSAPVGHNPTGAIASAARRRMLDEVAARAGAVVVEDLSLADLVLDADAVPDASEWPRRAQLVTIGSASKVFWAGLRIGWIRAEEPLRGLVASLKADDDLATSWPAQLLATRLLDAIDDGWIGEYRQVLRARRDHLGALLAAQLPAWRTTTPACGLSLWVELPVADAAAFMHTAAAHGVAVAPGSVTCVCGRHRHAIRLSFAEPLPTLELAVERLAWAWELHCQDLAATPTDRS